MKLNWDWPQDSRYLGTRWIPKDSGISIKWEKACLSEETPGDVSGETPLDLQETAGKNKKINNKIYIKKKQLQHQEL